MSRAQARSRASVHPCETAGPFYTREQCITMLASPRFYDSEIRNAARHRGLDLIGEPRIELVVAYLLAELGQPEIYYPHPGVIRQTTNYPQIGSDDSIDVVID